MKLFPRLFVILALLCLLAGCSSSGRKPESSVTSAESAVSVESSVPEEPSKPEEPSVPEESSKPEESSVPEESSKPEESSVPEESSEPEPPFTITTEDLEKEILWIREHYNHPDDADRQILRREGAGDWEYERDYRFHDGLLIFAFVHKPGDEHRLYYKDGHLIRYIDENHTVYDFGALEPFEDWSERVLADTAGIDLSLEGTLSSWLGNWYQGNGNGEYLEVLEATEEYVRLIYHGWTASGNQMFASEYTLGYENAQKTVAAEAPEVEKMSGYRYLFTLKGDRITMSSRYPDRDYYLEEKD